METKGLRIEVKFSSVNVAVKGAKTHRWVWSKPFGETGKKTYERLVLVGLKDPRYQELYLDKESPFVIFDVPFDEILPLTVRNKGGRYPAIFLSSNPRTARSAASPLYEKYQLTEEEFERRYSNSVSSGSKTASHAQELGAI